jgi:signal transduction histidine kinase
VAAAPEPNNQPKVRVTIADTGVGVPPENISRLFEPFFTTKNHGTGLGLPITRRILQEHHGDITVQSQVDKGTTFRILLPAGGGAH